MNTKIFFLGLLLTLVRASQKESVKSNKILVKSAKNSKTELAALPRRQNLSRKAKTEGMARMTSSASLESIQSSPNSSSSRSSNNSPSEPPSNYNTNTTNTETGVTDQQLGDFGLFGFGSSDDALIDAGEAPEIVEQVSEDTNVGTDITDNSNTNEQPPIGVFDIPWDLESEGEWCLGSMEFKQLLAATCLSNFSPFLMAPSDSQIPRLSCDNLSVEHDWPGTGHEEATRPSALFARFHLLAAKIIAFDRPTDNLRKLLQYRLIDLRRPIYEKSTQIYRSFLSFAIERENLNYDKIDLILKYMPKDMINKPNSYNVTPLDVAISTNNFILVHKFVEAGADMNILVNLTTKTPFMRAIELKDTSIIEYLLMTRKADFNIVLENGESALSLAARDFDSAFFQRILVAAVHTLTGRTLAAALKASFSDNNPLFVFLVTEIMKSQQNGLLGVLVLMGKSAVTTNNFAMLNFFKSLNIPMNLSIPFKKYSGYRFIHIAAERGQLEMVKTLLSYGIGVDEVTQFGKSVLHIAYSNSQFSVAEELIKRGAVLGLAECLEHAIVTDDYEFIDLALHSPLNLNELILPSGHNLITLSVTSDKPQILKKLLDNEKFNALRPDSLNQTIHTMPLPENASEELKELVKNAIDDFTDIFSDIY